MEVSVIVPLYNEVDSLGLLDGEISAALDGRYDYEVIYVDDGSIDGSAQKLRVLASECTNRCIIEFARNYGQAAALAAGIAHASGNYLVCLDADLQNDPADIPLMIDTLNAGFDVVSGWRKSRQDNRIARLLPSVVGNWLISWITGVRLHDYGCTLKAYRRQALTGFTLYGEMHRYIPAFASWQGARVTEQVVRHRARAYGRSKYGISRTFKVVLDVFAVKFLCDYSTKPLHVFGGLGLASIVSSFILCGLVVYQKLISGIYAHRNPFLLLAVMLFLAGMQALLMGLLAELAMRTYHESQNKTAYVIRDIVGSRGTRASS